MLTIATGILLAVAIIYIMGFLVLGIAFRIFREGPPKQRSLAPLVFFVLFLLAVIGEVIQGFPSFR